MRVLRSQRPRSPKLNRFLHEGIKSPTSEHKGERSKLRHQFVGILWRFERKGRELSGIPFIRSAYVPHNEAEPHAHALTSTIIFQGSKVLKVYAPGLLPRFIYWIAFQAEFPYMRNQSALRAAVLRRNLAGLLTEYWYGENRVAPALGIEEWHGRLGLASEFVDGHPPSDRMAGRTFLFALADRFDRAGLPTWQVDPRQPRAMDNILETPDGRFMIIDLESGLVSPLASPRAWWRAWQRAQVPIFDDVYFDLTREYIKQERAEMVQALGEARFGQLLVTLDRAEAEACAWHASEPRVWGRLARLIVPSGLKVPR